MKRHPKTIKYIWKITYKYTRVLLKLHGEINYFILVSVLNPCIAFSNFWKIPHIFEISQEICKLSEQWD